MTHRAVGGFLLDMRGAPAQESTFPDLRPMERGARGRDSVGSEQARFGPRQQSPLTPGISVHFRRQPAGSGSRGPGNDPRFTCKTQRPCRGFMRVIFTMEISGRYEDHYMMFDV